MNRKALTVFLVAVLLLEVFLVAVPLGKADVTVAWANQTLPFRKSHLISSLAGADVNYQVNFTVHYGAGSDGPYDVYLNSLCRSDFQDLRVYDVNGSLLSAWNQTQVNGDYVKVWVKLVANLTAASDTVYLYYGNASMTSYWNESATFVDVINGVVGAWNMEETTGTNIVDSSGNGNNATTTGTSIVASPFFSGKDARQFNGTGNYAFTTSSLNIGNVFAISVLIKVNATNFQHILSERASSIPYTFDFWIGTTGKLRIGITKSDNTTQVYMDDSEAGTILQVGSTYLLCGVYDGSNLITYVNGTIDNIKAASGNLTTVTSTLGIAKAGYSGSAILNGTLENAFIYQSLSATQISNLYLNYGDSNLDSGKILVRKYVGSDGPSQVSWGTVENIPYYAQSLTMTYGTHTNGTLPDLYLNSSNIVTFTEASGSSALDLSFNFTNLPTPTVIYIQVLQEYAAHVSDTVGIYLWSFVSSSWVQEGTLIYATSYSWVNMTIGTSPSDFVQNGNLTLRFFSSQIGYSTDKLYLDTLFLTLETNGPGFANVGFTSQVAGTLCTFHAYISDPISNDLQTWIFGTNNTGLWVNDSAVNFGLPTGEWANVTKVLNSNVGNVVAFQFYANCTDGNSAATTLRSFMVTLLLPVANFVWTPQNPVVNELISFTSTTTNDSNILSWEWNFGDGNITIGNYPAIIHSYAVNQSYYVSLTISDNEGLNTNTQLLTVLSAPLFSAEDATGLAITFGLIGVCLAITMPIIYLRRKNDNG